MTLCRAQATPCKATLVPVPWRPSGGEGGGGGGGVAQWLASSPPWQQAGSGFGGFGGFGGGGGGDSSVEDGVSGDGGGAPWVLWAEAAHGPRAVAAGWDHADTDPGGGGAEAATALAALAAAWEAQEASAGGAAAAAGHSGRERWSALRGALKGWRHITAALPDTSGGGATHGSYVGSFSILAQ